MNAIIVSAFLGVVMMFASWSIKGENKQKNIALFGLIFLILANLAQMNGWFVAEVDTNNMLSFTRFGLYTNTLFYCLTLIYIWINGEEISKIGNHAADFYALFFFILCGASILTSFNNLLMLFIGIEILSIPLYILTGSDKKSLFSNEAAIKYFLMGSFSTGILLLGITFIYGATGSFNLIPPDPSILNEQFMFSAGLILIFAAMNFKVSAAPFHFWTPDVYDGAPTIFTMFMSTVVKAASFAALYQLLSGPFGTMYGTWVYPIYYISMLTLLVGNITAVYQQSAKRMLAYSSISHAGYMLLTVSANQASTPSTILYYSLSYTLATIVAFGVVMLVAEYQTGRTEKPENFSSFEGLAKQNPGLAFCFTIALLSLAGIPLTAGFWGKFFVFSDIFNRHVYYPVILAIVMSAVGVYYYFKGIIAIYFKEGDIEHIELPGLVKFAMWACTLGTLLLGVYPSIVKNLF